MSPSPSSSATHVDAGASENEAPQIEALFLIRFDKKVGYTIAWKRSTSAIPLDNAVEYKSLPSGLHALESDLVYFTHEGHAGLSAFARGAGSAEERNANFVSVGVLVRRDGEFGRLGRAWLLAGRLEVLAKGIAEEEEGVEVLERFWEEHRGEEKGEVGNSKAEGEEKLPEYHPARGILQYVDFFGPLVFRLQQAALLRKRILFVGSPPVRAMCEFVYILSILSSLSSRDSELLLPGLESHLRLPTLFSIGVHDIPALEAPGNEGWAACTTDEIIATKTKLYDVVVEIHDATPRIRLSDGTPIQASQRDVERYKLLHRELSSLRSTVQAYTDDEQDEEENEGEDGPLIPHTIFKSKRIPDDFKYGYADSMIEPQSWSRLAYTSFMFWASAGERDANSTCERDRDRELLGTFTQPVEMSVVAYFHRLSAHFVQTLAGLVDAEDEDEVVVLGRGELGELGLDAWSRVDRVFVAEFGERWMGRGVEVRGGVECCGLRVGGM